MSSKVESVAEFLNRFKEEFELTPHNRIRCLLTGHEMTVSMVAVNGYINSKKYNMAKEWELFDSGKYAYIVPHKSDRSKMWCKLTKHALNKIPAQILKHVEGKKYKRLVHTYFPCKQYPATFIAT